MSCMPPRGHGNNSVLWGIQHIKYALHNGAPYLSVEYAYMVTSLHLYM